MKNIPGFVRLLTLSVPFLISLPVSGAGGGAGGFLKNPDAWFAGPDAARIAANILSYQTDLGGWPKNTRTVDAPFTGDRNALHPTFDNSATTDELRFLARYHNATTNGKSSAAFSKGLSYILKAQYPTGGWPQYYPPSKQYHRHITFNDDAMTRLMLFLREVCGSDTYAFVSVADRQAAGEAFDKGIACILKCQIRTNGKPTVWCAQQDEVDYSPRPGRAFELASYSGSESVGITRLLMSLDHPSPEVVQAVEGAVAWFESARITGIRVDVLPDPKSEKGTNKVVVEDPAAPPLWARFYDLVNCRPMFADRDGVAKATIAEIGYERRNGYSWYGTWPQSLLEKEYPAWKHRLGRDL